MPIYTFKNSAGKLFLRRLSIADFESIQAGEKALVDENDVELELVFNPGQIGFTLKDGESGGWPTRTNKERKFRSRRYDEMGRRQKEHAPKTRLVPNYGGQLADKWSDVQDHVRTTDGPIAATTYDRFVAKES